MKKGIMVYDDLDIKDKEDNGKVVKNGMVLDKKIIEGKKQKEIENKNSK